jgi:hypothetical protein
VLLFANGFDFAGDVLARDTHHLLCLFTEHYIHTFIYIKIHQPTTAAMHAITASVSNNAANL